MKRKMMKSIMRAGKLEPGTSRFLMLFESPDIFAKDSPNFHEVHLTSAYPNI